jgi:hypothetical protein
VLFTNGQSKGDSQRAGTCRPPILRPEDRAKVVELIQHRPVQFCMFLKALLGEEAMEEMMTQAISVADQSAAAVGVAQAGKGHA